MYKSLLGVALSALFLVAQPAFADAPIVIKFSTSSPTTRPRAVARCCSRSWWKSAWPAR